MKVYITKFNYQFIVSSPYNQTLFNLIKKIDKRYWCIEKKFWYLPLNSLEQFQEDLKNHTDFEVEIKEGQIQANITIIGENIEIKFSEFIDKFREFMDLSEHRYIPEKSKIILPANLIEKVISMCKSFNYEVIISPL